MISSAFYHTGEISANGMTLTNDIKSIADITDKTADYAYPYYMGYMNYDDMPSALKFWQYSRDDSTHVTFTETTKRNHGWGFMTTMVYLGTPVPAIIYTDNNSSIQYYPPTYTDGATKYRFLNNAVMASIAYANAVTLHINGIFVPVADLDDNDSAYGYSDYNTNVYVQFSQNITVGVMPGGDLSENLTDFLAGDSTLSVMTRTVNGESVNIKLDIQDMQSDSPVFRKQMTLGGVDYMMFLEIGAYSFPCYAAYKSENTTYRVSVVPFLEYDDLYENGEKWYGADAAANYNDFLRIVLDYYYGCQIDSVSAFCGYGNYETWYMGDFHIEGNSIYGTLDNNHPEACWWYRTGASNNFPGWGRTGIIRGRHMFTSESQGTGAFRMTKYFDPNDIIKHYMYFHKVDTLHGTNRNDIVPIASYTTDYSTALFDSLNKPLNERVQENFGAELLAKLQPWQYPNTDISIDEFKIEDVPPYEPEPSGDEDRSGGVDYTHNGTFTTGTATGFVTQYVLKAEQIASLGSYLWASFNSTDFIDSLLVAAGETFSFDTSKILDFIVSARQYPIGIQHLDSFDPVDDIIYIGRGLAGIDLNSGDRIGILTSYCEGVKGGFCDIPIEDKWKDFRGYEPCSRVTVIVPFCGALELAPSQAIGSRVYLDYAIDFSCGAVQACITIDNGKNKYIAGVLDGSIGANVELTASNLSQMLLKGMKAISTLVGAVALGAVGAEAAEASAMAGYESSMTSSGDQLVHSKFMESNTKNVLNFGSSISSIGNMSVSPSSHIGTASGFAAFQITEPIVRVEYRHYEVPSNYAHIYGYACNKAVTLGSLEGKGFTVCKNVDLTGVPATQDELAALEALLQSGVYL